LELNEAQHTRYLKAYDVCKRLLRELRISPPPNMAGAFLEPDEVEEGYPGMTLSHMVDGIRACAQIVGKEDEEIRFVSPDFVENSSRVSEIIRATKGLDIVSSWRALQGKIGRLHRLDIFDTRRAAALDFKQLVRPGHVSIVDLGDTDSPQ